jgi:hypothetical protein
METKRIICLGGGTLLLAALPWTSAHATDWLESSSATLRESYDGNVFLSDVNSQYLPANYQANLVPGSAVALKNRSSAVTTAAARLGVSLLPATGTNTLSQFSLAYTPEFDIYEGTPSETHYDHRVLGKLKGTIGAWSFGLDENFLYVDGSRYAPTYPGDLVSAWNVVAPRERRQQMQDRANLQLRWDGEQWFARLTGNLTYYDLQTYEHTNAGYQNYCTRYDQHEGVDLGYKLSSTTAVTFGGQFGRQYQEHYSFSTLDSSSDYYRVLGGLEGKPLSWLTVKASAGPDFRAYNAAAPVSHPHMVTYYDELSAAAKLSPDDTLTVEGRQFQWVSSLGNVPYFDTSATLNWHHLLSDSVSSDLGVKFLSADYRSADLVACWRDDTETEFTSGLTYAVSRNLSVNLTGEFDLGLNALPSVTDESTREFHRFLVSVGSTWQF